ncbi:MULTISPECIES: hypothetical protein [unclassified Methanoregula]|uniref:hypothetical protein n=1 Tax=unclassified Methanoregula TaxID=2649730 RepID=UPI0009D5CEFA|nr:MULTISPECIES: hypothetical protein [unclassified Methanoregula]OPX62527.1 MAG: hypothetical protein A4E33_02276 [Methanoregula sp. PtaB.Bin085]OPY31626.1 MAG: hypothetical protein A4E34_02819 [Methanoregula sp. PtaU1.Bin006]
MDRDEPASWRTKRIPRIWVAFGMLVIAVPIVLFLVSMKGCACIPMPGDAAPAVRTGPDSIHIVMKPDGSKHHNQVPVLTLFVNDREVTNQSAIAASRLPLVITPPEGLAFRDGAEVTLQGTAVAGNESLPVNIVIVATYPDTGQVWVIGDQRI